MKHTDRIEVPQATWECVPVGFFDSIEWFEGQPDALFRFLSEGIPNLEGFVGRTGILAIPGKLVAGVLKGVTYRQRDGIFYEGQLHIIVDGIKETE